MVTVPYIPAYADQIADEDLTRNFNVSVNPVVAGFHDIIDAYGNQYRYDYYIRDYANKPRPDVEFIIEAADVTRVEGMDVRFYENHEGVPGTSMWTDEDGLVEWTVDVAEEGLYNLSFLYYSVKGKNSDIQRSIFINGELPFMEASSIEFRRTWVNQTDANGEWLRRDNRGNELRPVQVEQHVWRESPVEDSMGTYTEPFFFYFPAGTHTITLLSQREPVIIRHIKMHQLPIIPTYAEFKAGLGSLPRPSGVNQIIQGQNAVRKSSPMLFPSNDNSSPAVTPYSPKEIRINTIGDGTWQSAGQWIEWEFEVPEDGLYKIAMNIKQNYLRGTNVYRKIYINDEVPFSELSAYPFAFRNSWRVDTLVDANDDPFLFWLEKGTHTIRMEVVLGDYAQYLRQITESVLSLTEIYRHIVMITGPTPDQFRDYQLNRRLPHLDESLRREKEKLDQIYDELVYLSGGKGERDTVIRTMSALLVRMTTKIEEIPKRQGIFKTNIGALGTWLMQVRDMAMAVDSIYILSADAPTPKVNNSWWHKLKHEIMTLFYSFIIDYNAIGNVSEDDDARNIQVWVGMGRDQANIIKGLIDENFTTDTGINVNLMLVDMTALLPATLSGQGPDVAMMVVNDLPMNYGMRGAVVDLTKFDDFEEVAKSFLPSAMVPYRFRDRCFALPETQSFSMLFYRHDVLHDLGLEIPRTWDDVKASLSVLSTNYMEFGIPVTAGSGTNINTADQPFMMFLYQAGGDLYAPDGVRSELDSDIAIATFRDFTKYWTDYKLVNPYDFANRFRFGEMPLAIQDYSSYNMLQVFAPEIRGLWGMTVVPGTVRPDGSIDHSVPTSGLASVMMERSRDHDAAWEFLKWWTSAETQTRFGQGMESLMGPAARYQTANQEAFAMLPWPVNDFRSIQSQFEWAVGVPQVPGGYFTSRQVNNAFYKVVTAEARIGPREALTDFTRLINDEISYKRREFQLD